jgi:hypothetical protein
MSYDPQPTTDEMLARMAASIAANEYGVLRISARRWAVIRRNVSLGQLLVGGRVLVDHLEYEVIEGHGNLTKEMALRALYDLTHGG